MVKKSGIMICLLTCLFGLLTQAVVSRAQVNTELMRKKGLEEGVHNSLNLELGLISGNSDFLKFSSGFRTDYRKGDFYTFGAIQYDRGTHNDELFVNKGFVHLRAIHRQTSLVHLELFYQKEFNDFILLNDRNLLGGGLRLAVRPHDPQEPDTRTLELYLGIGAMWEAEDLDTSPLTRTRIVRSTNYLSLNLRLGDRAYLGAVSYYQVNLEDFYDYRILMESGFGFDLSSSVTFRTTFHFRFDSDPPAGIRKYDMEIKNGVGILF